MARGKIVHTRKIEMNTFDLGNHQVLVEGELQELLKSDLPVVKKLADRFVDLD